MADAASRHAGKRRGLAALLALWLPWPAAAVPRFVPRLALPPAAPIGLTALPKAPSFQVPGAGVPGLPVALPAVKAVPGAAQATPLPVSETEAKPGVLGSLRELNARLASEQEPGSDPAGRTFDASGDRPDAPTPSAASPTRPGGIVDAVPEEVHNVEDLKRLVPAVGGRRALIAALPRMKPYRIIKYYDSIGGSFTALDLSQRPELIDILPGQRTHEVALIKKLQLWNKDLQVIFVEGDKEGKAALKTPDTMLAGRVTELKSLLGANVDLTFLLNKANNQVLAHAKRHSLGRGAVVIDITQASNVPTDQVLAEIEAWRQLPSGTEIRGNYFGPRHEKSRVWLDKIYVFAGLDLKEFDRQADDSFILARTATIPFAPPRPVIRKSPSRPKPTADEIETTVRDLMKRGQDAAALRAWSVFKRRASSAEVAKAAPRLSKIIARARRRSARPRKS